MKYKISVTTINRKSFAFEVGEPEGEPIRFRVDFPVALFGIASAVMALVAPKYFVEWFLMGSKLYVNDALFDFDGLAGAIIALRPVLAMLKQGRAVLGGKPPSPGQVLSFLTDLQKVPGIATLLQKLRK